MDAIQSARPVSEQGEDPLYESAAEREELFNRVAPLYDKSIDFVTLGLHRLWKRWSVSWSGVKEGDTVLDVCCGSGDIAFLLSEKVGINGKVIGLDFSKEFLEISASRQRRRNKECYKNIEWVQGDAIDLPFSDSYFDAATMGFGLRNIVDSNRKKALQEITRVLKPGSKLCVLDFNKSTSQINRKIKDWIHYVVVAPLASLYGLEKEHQYLQNSINEYYTGNELEKLALEAGFSEAQFHEFGAGYMGNLVATV
ncbi:hypothetical protein ACJIZ3_023861 [Penstemon smallii]|uniref:2-phytyl-1,4-beta-naphthoquinone methyltransferase, chloroplastic n=1 Tax=Penstemon smallii TaxID=265156 RepID=A0ABD3TQE6_9LAMI